MFCFQICQRSDGYRKSVSFFSRAHKFRGPLLLHSYHTALFLMLQMMYLFFVPLLCIPTFLTELDSPLYTDVKSQWSKSFRLWSSQSQGARWLGSLHGNDERHESFFLVARPMPRVTDLSTGRLKPCSSGQGGAKAPRQNLSPRLTEKRFCVCMGVPVFWRLFGVMRLLVSCTPL